MLVLTAAITPEVNGICRDIPRRPEPGNHGFGLWRGRYLDRELLVVKSGIGAERVQHATGYVLANYPVEALISLGFAGGLAGEIQDGDIVLCDTIHCSKGSGEKRPLATDARLREIAIGALDGSRTTWLRGDGLTVKTPVYDTAEKERLGRETPAHICEMEDYWIAGCAGSREVPFLAVRVISDDVRSNSSDLEHVLDGEGNVRFSRMMSVLLIHPSYWGKIPGLYHSYRRDQTVLADFTSRFLRLYFNVPGAT